jgi:hypothetical protein
MFLCCFVFFCFLWKPDGTDGKAFVWFFVSFLFLSVFCFAFATQDGWKSFCLFFCLFQFLLFAFAMRFVEEEWRGFCLFLLPTMQNGAHALRSQNGREVVSFTADRF